jgi:hypothetical protein
VRVVVIFGPICKSKLCPKIKIVLVSTAQNGSKMGSTTSTIEKKRFSVCSTHIIICVIFSNEFYDFSVLLLNFFDFFGVFYGIFMTHY